ncbi:hypothetical protein [Janibacter hoylei]|uniref:hypothetical protein n=1 Tax=Janibacter hoylei TaxID=364298 RepID=UPI00249035E7|nr:hypothetical protein [Janibacter hoylei]
MDTSLLAEVLLTRLAWSLPVAITATVIAVLALVRRDDGQWWKFVIAGCAALLLAQLVGLLGTTLLLTNHDFHRFQWITSIPTLVLDVLALGLLAAGAFTGRRPTVTPR